MYKYKTYCFRRPVDQLFTQMPSGSLGWLSDLIYVFQNREKEKGGGGGEKEAEKGEKEKELCWPKLSVGGDESAVS